MMILGPVQILLSFVIVLATPNSKLRTHLKFYFAMVGLYAGLLFLTSFLLETSYEVLFMGIFFVGGFGLAIYNALVFIYQKRLP